MALGHIGELILYVRDMEAQVRFYRDTLGFAVQYPPGLPDYTGQHWVTFATGSCTLALHSGGQAPAGRPPRFGFFVTAIEARRAELLAAGVEIADIREAAPGVLVCDATDPEGNGFFLEEHLH